MEALKGKVTPKDWMFVGAVLGAVVAILALYIFFVQKNQTATLDDLTLKIKTIQSDLSEAKKKEANIAALREEAAAIEKLVADFERRLPEQREIPTLVRQFEKMANDVGLS